MGYGRDPQHTALGSVKAMSFDTIRWSTPVDTAPAYSGNELLIHYGCPVITAGNTVIVTVKTGDTFHVEGHRGDTGALLWTFNTDYTVPPHGWYPSCGCTLTPTGTLIVPGSGGTIWMLTNLDSTKKPSVGQRCFYGIGEYRNNKATYDANVQIATPITSDLNGNVYFGYTVTAAVPNGLTSGVALERSNGNGAHATATAALPGTDAQKPQLNCAPAISIDGKTLYIGINNGWGFGVGYLVGLDTATLKTKYSIRLKDPESGNDAYLADDGTASPAVGPDGDVFYGVLENGFPSNHARGWMLHCDGALTTVKTPGAFGWDDTAAIFPASFIPSFKGTSKYLILTKYNNYVEGGGDGYNKVAVLAPNDTEIESVSGITTMKEVDVLLGQTPDPSKGGYREWCVNTVAIDPISKIAIANSEDGTVYRWDLVHNTVLQKMPLTAGIGEAYTSTIEGPDGTVYAISNAMLYAVGTKYTAKGVAAYASSKPGDVVSLSATFTRTIDAAPVVGATITYTTSGSAIGTAVTDAHGVATLAYTVPQNAAIGTSKYTASLTGNGLYVDVSSSNNLAISQHSVKISGSGVSGKVGQTVSLSATITRDDATKLGGATLTFAIDGTSVGSATTDTNGVATLSYTIPSSLTTGKHTLTATFAGDTADKSNSLTTSITVK
jgi:hypothetical protein